MKEGALAAGAAMASAQAQPAAPGNPGHCSQEGFGPKPGITNVAVEAGGREAGREAQSGASSGRRLAFPPAGFMEVTAAPQFLLRVKVKST